MHTQPVLQKFFRESLPGIHQRRCQALIAAEDAVARGARVSITGVGRSLAGSCTRIKHRVKRIDRLIGNRVLGGQRKAFYRAIVLRLLAGCPQPMILIDGSDFSADRQQQLLRASLAVDMGHRMHRQSPRLAPDGERQFVEQVANLLANLPRSIARPIYPQPTTTHLPGQRCSNRQAVQSISAVECVIFVGIGQCLIPLIPTAT